MDHFVNEISPPGTLDVADGHVRSREVMSSSHVISISSHLISGLVIAITHDRYFLDNVAGYILEISEGYLYPFKGYVDENGM